MSARIALLGQPTRAMRRLDDAVADDEAGRGHDRHRRIALATVAGVASRGLTALTLLIALPLASAHLGSEELGVWTLLVTATALLGFADLGLSNGLLTVLSDALGRDDRTAARRAVSAAVAGLCLVAVAGAVVVAGLSPVIDWSELLQVHPAETSGLGPAVAAFAGIVLFSIPAGIGQRIHMAYQQGWAAAAVNGAGSVLALAAVVVAASADAGLPWFVAAMLAPPVLACAAESAWVLGRSHRDLRPRRHDLDPAVARRLLRSGFLFFVLGAAGAAAYQSDSLVIAHYLGASEVTRYGVSLRLFMLAPTLLGALLLPLWPAYGEATARRDLAWVRTTLRRSVVTSVAISAGASAVLLLVARPVLEVWTPDLRMPSTSLLLALAVWAVVSSCSVALAMYFNGTNVIRLQVVLAILMASSNLALSIALVSRLGVAGPVWASVATQTVVVLIPELIVVRRAARTGLAPARVATWLSRAHCREVAGPNRTAVRRMLSAVRKAWLRAADPSVAHDLDGSPLLLPLSHDLPVHRAVHPSYSGNLGAVAQVVADARPGATMVDIGANVGDSVAIVRARSTIPILCVEGDEVFLPYLWHNLTGRSGVEVAATYVATASGAPVRSVVERSGGTARLVDRDDGEAVAVRDLARILADHPAFARPALVKVDTDGHDAAILRTAADVVSAAHPVLFFEHDPAMAAAVGAEDPGSIFGFLAGLGYASFLVYANAGDFLGHHRADALGDLRAQLAHLHPGAEVPYVDVCAIHEDDLDLVEPMVAATRGA